MTKETEESFPAQVSESGVSTKESGVSPLPSWDMRQSLEPSRLTIAMWDYAYFGRHRPGQSMADYPAVLSALAERGYNCVRIDPFPQLEGYLEHPERVYAFPGGGRPYVPWGWNDDFEMAAGTTVIEFVEEVRRQGLNMILSAWWMTKGMPPEAITVTRLDQGAELFAKLLETWKQRFGFEGLVYVDLCNEMPYFIDGFLEDARREVGLEWYSGQRFTPEQAAWLAAQINPALGLLQRAFPELRFTISMHGDTRWLDVAVQCDCLDVHFYADADPRWKVRTRFGDFKSQLFTSRDWHAEFSERWRKSRPCWPQFRARQRAKMEAFAGWAQQQGMPLTTTEGWAAWYVDHAPDYDLQPLIAWSEWAVEDAVDCRFWGWTAHSYIQPQYGPLWDDVSWHQRMTSAFLNG